MKKETNKNEEIQSRREFFKKAAKSVLPIVGAMALTSVPILGKAKSEKAPTGCNYGCQNSCYGACRDSCYSGCKGSCDDGCQGSCKRLCQDNCYNGCQGSCKGSCNGGNSHYNYRTY